MKMQDPSLGPPVVVTSSRLDVRDDLVDLEPYVSPQLAATYRMNTNESPYPPPASVTEEVARGLTELTLNRYPDREAEALHETLAGNVGWDRYGVWIGNGSNEVLQHLFLAFGGPRRSAVTFDPTYSLHGMIARITGTKLRRLERDDEFHIDLDLGVAAIREHRPEIVVACSPNNPTGDCEPLDAIRVLCEETAGLVVVDEAYIEFAAPEESARALLEQHRNLVLVRTFSKSWRLAGVRLGYLMAQPDIVDGLRRVRLPYHLSAVTQAFGLVAIRHHEELSESVEAIVEQRDRIAVELQSLGVMTYPSRANFVLFEADDADAMWRALLNRGILVRNYSGTHPRLARCLRVTAGTADECNAFLEAVNEVLLGDE